MHRLWFHQVVLFSEYTASVAPKPIKTSLIISESSSCSYMLPPMDEEKTSTDKAETLSPGSQVSSKPTPLTSQDDSNKEEGHWERHKIVNLSGNRVHLHSSSSSTPKHHMKFRKMSTTRKPEKSISYRIQGELELEEVKGFMDLGFLFKKENVCARMMNIIPGLQRLGMHHNNEDGELNDASKAIEKEGERDINITGPYLSDAWLIKRPDSLLLNLKIPRLCSSADMKKHIRFWAKTVAFEIHQE